MSDAVYEIAVSRRDIRDAIFSRFDFADPDFEQEDSTFLQNAVGTMHGVTEYEKLAKLIHEISAVGDFEPNIHPNFRAEYHERRWYHLDTKHPALLDPDFNEQLHDPNPGPEEQAIANVTVEEYRKPLSQKAERSSKRG